MVFRAGQQREVVLVYYAALRGLSDVVVKLAFGEGEFAAR